jgi:hypothetical protein
MKTYILYTTSEPKRYEKRASAIAAEWSKTKGRGLVTIVVQHKIPDTAPPLTDHEDGKLLSWDWFKAQFPRDEFDGVIFHFSRHYYRKWGMKRFNGAKNHFNKEYPEFWLSCDADQKAGGYTDLKEFERIMYHEHAHYDEEVDDAVGDKLTNDSVHTVDYKMKQIDKYHLLVDYRGKDLKEQVKAVINKVIKLAKKYI